MERPRQGRGSAPHLRRRRRQSRTLPGMPRRTTPACSSGAKWIRFRRGDSRSRARSSVRC
eukprot:7727660-Pyramimonas_sp.AAC.1